MSLKPLRCALLTCGIVFATTAAPLAAQSPKLPKTTAVLDIDVPKGTRIFIARKDKGAQTKFTYNNMPAGKYYRFEVKAKFPRGGEAVKWVMLRGGWYVRLPLRANSARRIKLVAQSGHSRRLSCAAFSPDGRYLVTGSSDGKAILWDAKAARQLRVYNYGSWVQAVAYSPNGKNLAIGYYGKGVLVRVADGKLLKTFSMRTGVRSIAFSPNGRLIFFGAYQRAEMWDIQSGIRLRVFEKLGGAIVSASFSRDGRWLLMGSWDKTASVWDVATGKRLRTLVGHTNYVNDASFRPDGLTVVTVSFDGTAVLWNWWTRNRIWTFHAPKNKRLRTVQFCSGGKRIIVSGVDGVFLLDAKDGRLKHSLTLNDNYAPILTLHPNDKDVFVGCDRPISWNSTTNRVEVRFPTGTENIRNLQPTSSSMKILMASVTNVSIRDSHSLQLQQKIAGHKFAFQSATVSPDGRRVLTWPFRGPAVLWDATRGAKTFTLQFHGDSVNDADFSPDGKHVVTCSDDHTAAMWDVNSGKLVRVFRGHTKDVNAVRFSANGSLVLTGSRDDTAKLWHADTGQLIRTFRNRSVINRAVAFHPDGQHVASGGYLLFVGGFVTIWSIDGRKIREFHVDRRARESGIQSVRFSPDGHYLLATCEDGWVVVWNVSSGQRIRTLIGHTNYVYSGLFLDRGRRILTAATDGTTRLWDMATGETLASLISLNNGADWLVVTPDGLFDGTANGRQRVAYRVGKQLVPVDRFFQDFYRPGLWVDLRKGLRPKAEFDLGTIRPPTIAIHSPRKSKTVTTHRVVVATEASDQGGGIKGPYLMHNGARVLARSKSERIGKTVKRMFTIDLVQGDNHITVKAASADGSWESEPASIVLKYAKPLDKAELYVLAVGINKYSQEALNLKYAVQDAKAVGKLFQARGKNLYRNVHVTALLNEQVSKKKLRDSLKAIAGKARPQDTLIVFMAGHGAMVYRRYYFIPADFRTHQDKSLNDDVRQQGIAADVIGDYLARVPALKRILILDTCNSGGAINLTKTSRNPFAFRGAIERLSRAQGVFTIAASAAGDEAQEVKELGHGVLTYALLAGLGAVKQGPLQDKTIRPGNPEQVVEVLEWFSYASGQVPRLTRRYFGREQAVETRGQGRSFPVLPVED